MAQEKGKQVDPLVFSVSEFCAVVQAMVKTQFPPEVCVVGEVVDYKRSKNGHGYFSLKDAQSVVPCVIWSNTLRTLKYTPQNGQRIQVHAALSFYAPAGRFQLNVQKVQPLGQGDAQAHLERLKAQLQAEGLFALERKKALPRFISSVALVTSESGAALKDILARFQALPVRVLIFHAVVQGDSAPDSIIQALQDADSHRCDVLILSRGGGASTDLSVFNNEILVRTLAQMNTPTITGIGHEVDFSLCDGVADCRASTPTDAAMRVVERVEKMKDDFVLCCNQIHTLFSEQIQRGKGKLNVLKSQFAMLSPQAKCQNQAEKLATLRVNLPQLMRDQLDWNRQKFNFLKETIELVNPLKLLAQGYALVSDENKKLIFDGQCVKKGALLHIQMAHVTLRVRVENILED